MTVQNPHLLERPYSRAEYFLVVRTALAAGEYPFARQALMKWLATFPGDLRASLFYAQALVGEKRFLQAGKVLRKLCILDPEDIDAVKMLLDVIERMKKQPVESDSGSDLQESNGAASHKEQSQILALEMTTRAHRFALEGPQDNVDEPVSWGGPLWLARQALDKSELNLSKGLLAEVLHQDNLHPLVGITHLQLLGMDQRESSKARVETANEYYQRSPDTLYYMIRLADWLLETGPSDFAVALLHQAAARDVEGRVIQRLWGKGHPYRPLWPEQLRLQMDFMVPGIVARQLGWNRLPAQSGRVEPAGREQALEAQPVRQMDELSKDTAVSAVKDKCSEREEAVEPSSAPRSNYRANPARQITSILAQRKPNLHNKEVLAVENELEKLAARFNMKGITRQDGRFPVYVILSIRGRLCVVYGEENAKQIESEMRQLSDAVRRRPGWGGKVLFADDPACTLPIGAKPVKPDDPWGCKLLLTDLDEWLRKRGERIGALLIVGGPEIVPFHRLPNPVDDPDADVPSDNPYATRDENYFIPEWPVGRLPGGSGSDARVILDALRRFQAQHASFRRQLPWKIAIPNFLRNLTRNIRPNYRRSFGYTAEIWREAAASVFRSIGRPGWMHVSPPAGMEQNQSGKASKSNSGLRGIPDPSGKIAYFNLHGKVDVPEWFGHRDPLRFSNEPDYPVALRPQDIQRTNGPYRIPQVVFSEACYGMHIAGKKLDEAIALKFLDAGSSAIAGSTCMAYGSVSAAPMVAADLLGFSFWRFLKQGMTAGEALRQAKIFLASEMNRRQDFLDGEDQKTLISFILYGDPLAEPMAKNRTPKSVRFRAKPLAQVRATCDCEDGPRDPLPVPMEVMDGVRRAVAKYLPGMIDARLAYVREHEPESCCSGEDEQIAPQVVMKKNKPRGYQPAQNPSHGRSNIRSLVTLSKQVAWSGDVHLEIARLTLDEQGKLMKLVVSR